MAMSKKSSRSISVDGHSYRWAVSEDSGYSVLVVQDGSGKGSKLEVQVPWAASDIGADIGPVAVTPAKVVSAIQQALRLGWDPQVRDISFRCRWSDEGKIGNLE